MSPFLKWAGGKRRSARWIAGFMPDVIDGYCEPFLGGGGVFLHLLGEERFAGRVLLGDRCWPLINTWRAVQQAPRELLARARAVPNTERAFRGALRALNGRQGSLLDLAALFLFINAAAYGGLYRTNRKGAGNSSFGNRPVLVFNDESLLAVSAALAKLREVRIVCADFELLMEHAPRGVIYQDPPYMPDRTGGFTSYAGAFGRQEHARLMSASVAATRRGCVCYHSNHDTPSVREVYAGMRWSAHEAHRAIGNRHSNQRSASELLGELR